MLLRLLRFSVASAFAAEFAIFLEFKSVGIVFLVLFCVVVSLFALCAGESYLDSYVISHF